MHHHINPRYPFCYTSPVALLAFCLLFQAWGTKARVEFRKNSQVNPHKFGAFFSCRWESKAHICSGWWRLLRDNWSHLTVHSWELLSMVWALCKHGWPQLPKALHLFLRGRWNCPEFSQKKNLLNEELFRHFLIKQTLRTKFQDQEITDTVQTSCSTCSTKKSTKCSLFAQAHPPVMTLQPGSS